MPAPITAISCFISPEPLSCRDGECVDRTRACPASGSLARALEDVLLPVALNSVRAHEGRVDCPLRRRRIVAGPIASGDLGRPLDELLSKLLGLELAGHY